MFKQEELLVLEVLAHETNSVKNDTQVACLLNNNLLTQGTM